MTEKLQAILEAEDLASLLDKFNEQGVTDSILGDLTDSDLKELGIGKLGERKRLLAAFGKSGGGAVGASFVEESSSPTSAVAPSETEPIPVEATKDAPFVNTLGMPFVPIPRFDALFCIWPVRVQDYEAYCMANQVAYPSIDFQQDSDHPIVCVSWNDAIEFCVWLTEKERGEGKIDEKTVYRLPTDLEWSAAVGLPHEPGATPAERDGKASGYPWGLRWPPPKGVGNYGSSLEVDSFEFTSPVGSFPANAFGIYDLGGNVWEWCMDRRSPDDDYRVVRGASWRDNDPGNLLSSFRGFYSFPGSRDVNNGFRCVLVGGSSR